MTDSNHGPDQWQQSVNRELSDIRQDVDVIQNWRITHMSECHPAIISRTQKLEGRWAVIAGIAWGVGIALGYVTARLIDRWFTG